MFETKVPAIRFEGFSGLWEEVKLGKLGKFQGGGTPSTSKEEYWRGSIPWISSSDINDENITKINVSKFINKVSIKESATKIILKDSILFVSRVGVGKLAIAHTDLCTSQDFTNLTLNSDYSYFIGYFFLSKNSLLDKYSQGTSIKGFTSNDLKTLQLNLPSKQEQIKIGNYFQNLDRLIEQKEKKQQKLKQLKKAMLSKMFPKEGADVPEIRFDGFSGVWEEKKLGEYSKFRRGSFPQPYGKKEWYDGDGAMPFIQVVDVNNTLSLVDDSKQKISLLAQRQSVLVKKGTVVVTLQGSIGRVAILQYDAYVDRTLLIFESFNNKTNIDYWAYLMQKIFELEKKKAPGGIIKTITKEALSNFKVLIPSLKEQTKIGNYFQKLDKLIDLQQKELEKLKNIKKASLDKMFV